jgi:60 kDa SS-A/Ro ribonucleoprotein
MSYQKHFSTRKTSQRDPIPGKDMVKNNAGGYGFAVDDWKRLERFLILGAEGGTYYVREPELTKRNAEAVMRCIKEDGIRTVEIIVDVSKSGRAPKNDPALFALAMAAGLGDAKTKQAALDALPVVAVGTWTT